MFQRSTRQAFPARNIVILLAIVLVFLFFLVREAGRRAENAPKSSEENEYSEGDKRTPGGLRPAEWFYAIRNYPDFSPDINTYTQALQQARQQHAVKLRGNTGFSAPWTLEGPANIGARINTIAVHPLNSDIRYAGYSGGGLWKTTDGGVTWLPVFDQQLFLAIGDITLDPQNPDIVYVATGDPNIGGYPFIGNGVWKSTNGGASWQHLGLEAERIISKIIVHPTQPNILFAAAMGLPFERTANRGLYRSTNGGASWQKVLYIGPETGITDVKMAPDNPNILYAAAWDRIRNNSESVVAGKNARIWKSIDGGGSWTPLAGGLPVDETMSRIGLAVDPGNAQHILATYTTANTEYAGLYETFDAGTTWQLNPGIGLNPNFRSNFAWYFGRLEVNPYNTQDIWVLGVTTYRSLDGGQTWFQAVGNGFDPHVDHHDIHFLNATTFLLATDGGLYQSVDNGVSWQKAENIPTTQFYRVAHNPHAPWMYTGGSQDNGTITGYNGELENWIRVFGGDGFQAVYHPENSDIFYFEYQNGGLVGTTDGEFIESATEGINNADRRSWDMPVIMSRHDSEIMYCGTYRVYQSYGHLPYWDSISPDLTDGIVFGARYHVISTVAESPLDAELIFAGTSDGNVWRGNSITHSWVNISPGLPDRYVSAVAASPNDPNRVFVCQTGYRDNDSSPLLHRSDNRGETWTPINGDLPNLAINDIFVLPGHKDSILFAGTDGGVWGTIDGGSHWERLGTGIPLVPVYDLGFNPELNRLVAGTHARSILSFPIDSLQLENLSNNDPNALSGPELAVYPSLATTRITLAISRLSLKKQAEVLIIDASGREAGRYQLRGGNRSEQPLPVAHWAPGVYFAIARTDGKVWGHKKFIIAR